MGFRLSLFFFFLSFYFFGGGGGGGIMCYNFLNSSTSLKV
jgi:hypothetical protein